MAKRKGFVIPNLEVLPDGTARLMLRDRTGELHLTTDGGDALAQLEEFLGDEFTEHVSDELLEKYWPYKEQALQLKRAWERVWESPAFRRHRAKIERAAAGNRRDLVSLLEENPIAIVSDDRIEGLIREKQKAGAKAFLETVADAFRRGLLKPKTGRPRKVPDPESLDPIIRRIEAAAADCSIPIRKEYRNTAARRLAIADFAEHLSGTLPKETEHKTREQFRHAVVEALNERLSITRGFGVRVMAKFYGVTSQRIRYLRREHRKKP